MLKLGDHIEYSKMSRKFS